MECQFSQEQAETALRDMMSSVHNLYTNLLCRAMTHVSELLRILITGSITTILILHA